MANLEMVSAPIFCITTETVINYYDLFLYKLLLHSFTCKSQMLAVICLKETYCARCYKKDLKI